MPIFAIIMPHHTAGRNGSNSASGGFGIVGFQTIRIKQYAFQVSAPFAEGHRLTAGEAQALNGLRAENVRNNISRIVADAVAVLPPGQLLSTDSVANLQTRITVYDLGYKFLPKHTPVQKLGPIEVEANAIAQERLTDWLNEHGMMNLPEAEWKDKVEAFAKLEEVQIEARARVSARQAVAASALDELL